MCGEKLRVSMLGEKVREEKDRLWVCHERESGRVSVWRERVSVWDVSVTCNGK